MTADFRGFIQYGVEVEIKKFKDSKGTLKLWFIETTSDGMPRITSLPVDEVGGVVDYIGDAGELLVPHYSKSRQVWTFTGLKFAEGKAIGEKIKGALNGPEVTLKTK